MNGASHIVKDSSRMPSSQSPCRTLIDRVILSGYCIGCGACTFGKTEAPFAIELNECGMYEARLNRDAASTLDVLAVCPFSGESLDEDQIGTELYGHNALHDPRIGYHLACYAGHACEGEFRERGSSGGLVSWVLCELLRVGLVDRVVHVVESDSREKDEPLFVYGISSSAEDVQAAAKSRYYPIELSKVLQQIREHPGRYVIVGVPCFIKAVRLLARKEPIFAERIKFCVALFCGHLKSAAFAEFIGWQCGIVPGNLESIDFRKKLEGRQAWDYGVKVQGVVDGQQIVREAVVGDLYGADWGLGFFKYNACDFCDDVVGETADISIGDAWLPEYMNDHLGTNIAVVRDQTILDVLANGIQETRLALRSVDSALVIASQEGGFRHRREGLAYRLHRNRLAGNWHPPTRVTPLCPSDSRFRAIHDKRSELAASSHRAWLSAKKAREFTVFVQQMDPLVRQYKSLYAPSGRPMTMFKRVRCWLSLGTRLRRLAAFAKGNRSGFPSEL